MSDSNWGKGAINGIGWGQLATNDIGAGSIYSVSHSGETALIGVSAAFSYSASTFTQADSDPTPTITGTTGGTFSGTSGLVFVSTSTGEIDLSASSIASHVVTYTVNGVSADFSLSVTAAPFSNQFSFDFDGIDESFAAAIPGSFFSRNNAFSISLWTQSDNRIHTKGVLGNGSSANCIRLRSLNSGSPVFGIKYQFFMSGTFATSAFHHLTVVSDGLVWSASTWYNIVITYDGSSTGAGLKMYINNGTPKVSTSADFTNSDCVSSSDFAMGALRQTPFSLGLDGRLDEVAIFNTELSSSDVATIWGSGSPSSLSSLSPVHWFRMGEEATFSNPGGTGNWTMSNQGSSSIDAVSENMEQADRKADTP